MPLPSFSITRFQRTLLLVSVLTASAFGCSKGSTSFPTKGSESDTGGGTGGGSGGTLNCGNGRIDPDEDCEPGNLDGATCESFRFEDGVLGCDPRTCTYDTSMCSGQLPPQGGNSG